MVLKKRHSINVQEDGPKRRRKEEVREEPEDIKKKSKKGNEYPVKVEENRLSDDEYEEDDPEEDEDDEVEEEDEDVNDDTEGNAALGKENINEKVGWPQADIIELFDKIEAGLPRNDIMAHSTRIERINWEEIAFNNYSPSECKRVWSYVHKRIRHFRVLKEVLADARIWVHKPWTDFYKGSKTANHPDMPRKPPTKYLLYYAAKRDKVTAQNPNLDMTKISKIVSQMWNALPASKKSKYDQMAAELKIEYNEKLRLFYEQHPGFEEEAKLVKIASNNKKLPKSLPAPTGLPNKPRTAKTMFIEDKLEKVKNEPNLDRREARAEASTQWDNLSDKKRLMWIERAVEEENKYLEKLKLHKADNPEFEMPKHKTVLTKDEVLLRNRASGKPSKPPNSAYSLYSKIMLAKCADLRSLVPKERMKEISLRWNKMSDSEKEEYQKKVKYEQERFKLDYATYLESLPEEERQEELLKTQKSSNPRRKAKVHPEVNNGKKAKSKSTKTNKKASSKKVDRQYFPGEPHQPPVNAYDLFVDSFVSDTKLCATEAPRFWEMLPNSDKAKFTRKLTELKEKYIRDYKKFLKSLDEEQVAKYNELQKRNKEREAAAETQKEQLSDADEDSDEESSSEEAANENETVNNKETNDSDSDENNETENKKSDSSSDSSSSSSESSSDSSSSDDSDSSSDDSDDEDKTSTQVAVKKEGSDSDSDSD